jgi:superkiller protein 3
MEREIGLSYSNSRLAFQTILATSYVHHFSPKHHPLAAPLLDTVLAARPEDSQALTGRGYVLEAKEVWDEAEEMFARAEVVLARDGKGAVWDLAREEKAWCAFKAGKKDEGREALKAILSGLAENSVDPAILAQGARVAWKLGTCYWEMGGRE